jgi:hypothetical protein
MKVSKWTRKDGTRVIKHAYDNGYSCERTYDKSGREKTFKNSRGYSCEYTYDEEGNWTIKEI